MSDRLQFARRQFTVEAPDADVLPAVVCSLGVGRLVDNIEIDAPYYAGLMKRRGMSDEAILATKININDDLVIDDKTKRAGESPIKYGGYTPAEQAVTIELGGIKYVTDYSEKRLRSEVPPHPFDPNESASSHASEISVHELSHRIDDAAGDDWLKEKHKYYAQFAPEMLTLAALRKRMPQTGDETLRKIAELGREIEVLSYKPTYEQYENAPNEQRAAKLTDDESSSWKESGYRPIRITFKQPTEQI